ncbi:phosphoribosyl-ATP diphosphatase [Falsiroseomonas tokyonensis]|uniref:Phosphoribosyl-ATP pyrophosphatase n=1 Tax=Falsiroseomonas tokyonensis TaxID=430521 RepID=A0ABV7BSD7_9PROT|nr:phosphoribosyl-ATP diphosphatase [Falsiroseomonas tokyonensis]
MAKTVKRAATAKGAKAPAPKAKPAKAAAKVKPPKQKPAPKAKLDKARRKSAKVAAALPLPASIPAPQVLAKPRAMAAGAGALEPFRVEGAEAAILDALWRTVEARRAAGDVAISHSARLLARGTAKVAQKLGEEAVECVIEATLGNRHATVLESADLLYHLVVVWVDAGIAPEEVWAELARRQGISGIAEKAARPKALVRAARTTKLP